MQVGYPLVTLLLSLGDPHMFKESFSNHLDLLYKLLKVIISVFIIRKGAACIYAEGFSQMPLRDFYEFKVIEL